MARLSRRFLPRVGRTSGAFLCSLIAIVAATIAPSLVRAETVLPAGLREAVVEMVEATPGHEFAGLCDEIVQSENDGKWCASVLAVGETQADIRYGPISTSPALTPLYYATFVKATSGWLISANTAPFAFGSEVPAGLRAAIRSAVESDGNAYAGLCGEINPLNHTGQHCVSSLSLNETKAITALRQLPDGAAYQETFANSDGVWTRVVVQEPVVTDALRAAIRSHIQERGYEYAGFCDEIRVTANSKVWCASAKSLSDSTATVLAGSAVSSERFSINLALNGSKWSVRSSTVPQNVPAQLLNAIEDEIEDKGHRYVGLCDDISLGHNSGNWCAEIDRLSAEDARVYAREVRSSNTFRIDFELRRSGWIVVSSNVPFAIPDALRISVQAAVIGRGYQFAGFCEELSQLPSDGKWCASISMQDVDAAVVAFKAARQPQYSANFVKVSGGWTVQSLNLPLNVPAALRLAIAQAVNAAGHSYAGLCEEIDLRANATKTCATVVSQSNTAAVVRYGRVQSNETFMLSLAFKSGAWTVVANSGIPTPVPTLSPAPSTPVPAPSTPSAPSTPQTPAPLPSVTPEPQAETPVPAPTQTPEVEEPVVIDAGVPDSLRTAIQAYVEAQGFVYAGLCGEIDQSRHLGERCAFVLATTDSTALVTFGLVLSDEVHEVNFVQSAGVWTPVVEAETEDDEEGLGKYLPFMVVGLGAVVAAGGLGAAFRPRG